jgi:leucyl aminopeptidase
MPDGLKLAFGPFAPPSKGVLILFADESLRFGAESRAILKAAGDLVERAAAADGFKGKVGSTLDLVSPTGLPVSRLVVVGLGKLGELKPKDFARVGGIAAGKFGTVAREVTIFCELPSRAMTAAQAAEVTLGTMLRAYAFERYKTKRKENESAPPNARVMLAVGDPAAARRAWRRREAVGESVLLARDLVNEPGNVLFPEEFARRALALKKLDVDVEVLDAKAMRRLGMNALLAVAQGSRREARLVVMRWNGGKRSQRPIAFIGKGVTFDSGGLSMKPAQGMEEMKGDMAGAACVVGLMRALAARKARVNAVGAIGLVENMPDGNAQRPGDIVTSMSGQTIEVINTDAEGRLVLADALWYVRDRFKPQLMIDLATLTGAIVVALGQEHAGLFSNDNTLAERLLKCGEATGERVWRMPLAPEYDKLIDSKFADMKNVAGRQGGAITAAQFLRRFVDDTPWAHLDIAGTGIGAPQTDINRSWAPGWGVRLLDAFLAEHYER